MKKRIFSLLVLVFVNNFNLFSKYTDDSVQRTTIETIDWVVDNPKGKFKIRFIKNEDKSDTTTKPKSFFGKLKNVVNMILSASDNPPFRVEIIREKEKKN